MLPRQEAEDRGPVRYSAFEKVYNALAEIAMHDPGESKYRSDAADASYWQQHFYYVRDIAQRVVAKLEEGG